MSEGLNQTDHELRSLIRFGFGIGFKSDVVRDVYHQVCMEAEGVRDLSGEDRMAEVRRRLILAAG